MDLNIKDKERDLLKLMSTKSFIALAQHGIKLKYQCQTNELNSMNDSVSIYCTVESVNVAGINMSITSLIDNPIVGEIKTDDDVDLFIKKVNLYIWQVVNLKRDLISELKETTISKRVELFILENIRGVEHD